MTTAPHLPVISTWAAGRAPTAPPYRGVASGTFTAGGAVNDFGHVSIQGQDTAVPSPVVGILQAEETLSGHAGTLELRCTHTATDFSDLSAVPGTSPCAITREPALTRD
jgi:hypothetical protein